VQWQSPMAVAVLLALLMVLVAAVPQLEDSATVALKDMAPEGGLWAGLEWNLGREESLWAQAEVELRLWVGALEELLSLLPLVQAGQRKGPLRGPLQIADWVSRNLQRACGSSEP
jgi:hypothetical protein